MIHGSPEDRGSADSYYGRGKNPHKMVGHQEVTDLTATEVTEYNAGYDRNESERNFKQW